MDKLLELLKKYFQNQVEIVSIKTEQRLKGLVSQLFKYLILFSLAASGLLFSSLTLAMLVNYLLDSQVWGFASVALIYIALLLYFIVSKKGQNYLIQKLEIFTHKIINDTEQNEQ